MAHREGIWTRSDNKFYQLETGPHSVSNPQERLRRMLVQRGVIVLTPDNISGASYPYKLMTVEEAKESNYEVVTLYLNRAVKDQYSEEEGSPARPAKNNAWGE